MFSSENKETVNKVELSTEVMGRPFCSSAFWDADLTWNTESPDFTPCFENTVLTIVPCAFLWAISLFYLFYVFRWPRSIADPLPLTRLGALRSILSLILAFLALMNFFRTVSEEVSGLAPELSLYFGPIIQAITFVWTIAIMHLERRGGIINSAPLFLFWLLLSLCGVAQLFTYSLSPSTNDQYRVAVYCVYYAFLIIQLVASCFIDVLPLALTADKKISPEARASFLSYLTFHWINGLCWTGFRKTLTQDDIFKLHPRDLCKTVIPQLEKNWQYELVKKERFRSKIIDAPSAPRRSEFGEATETSPILKHASTSENYAAAPTVTVSITGKEYQPSLMKAFLKTYGPRVFVAHLCKLVYDFLQFVSPIALQWLINYTQNTKEPQWHGYVYALVIFLAGLLSSVFFHQLFHLSLEAGVHMKAALISLIYKKALTMTSQARRDSTVGEVVNLMSVDTERLLTVMSYIWVLWSAPLQIIIALIMLWGVMGTSVLAGVAVMVLLIPLNGVIAALMRKMQTKQMAFKDKRTRLLTEILSGIKILKLYAWEISFREKVKAIREEELIVLRQAAYLSAVTNFTWICAPYLVMLATFVTFIYTSGMPLTPDKAFVALSLFNILRAPLNILPMIIAYIAQAAVSVKRIGRFLSHPDLDAANIERIFSTSSNVALQVNNGKFAWSMEDQPVISGINLKVKRGKLVAIVGPVGCGKSSLLSAMLGDMERVSGHVTQNGSLAYVAQQAWIQNATIRDNILFGKKFDQDNYKKIVEACALQADMQILQDGDATEIGEKGINLSGGQKQRVALARAVYQDRDIVLLDDPLSAVDAHVGKHIFQSVIGPDGLLKDKTRILVTHGLQWLPHCDEIVVMADGKITDVGSFKDLIARGGTFANFIRDHLAEAGGAEAVAAELPTQAVELLRQISTELEQPTSPVQSTPPSSKTPTKTSRSSTSTPAAEGIQTSQRKSSTKTPVAQKLIEDERQETGGVKWSVFTAYLKALGLVLCFFWFGFFLVSQGFAIFGNIWLTIWTSDEILLNVSLANTTLYSDTVSKYLGLYGAAAGGQAMFIMLHSMFYAVSSVKASRWIHESMLENILHCAMSFFDTTPTGRILNRFSKDCDTVDNVLPQTLRSWLSTALQVLTTVFIIIYGFPLFAVVVLPLGLIYYFVQRFYIPTTRQLKRIESVTRSPIYNHFSETLTGAATIRAFGEQQRFMLESAERVDLNNTSYFASLASNRWLGIRLELIGNITIFIAALFAMFYRNSTNSSIVGLSISYSLQVTSTLNWLVRMSSDLESNVVSVERMEEYIELPTEAAWERHDSTPPKSWPSKGEIVLENYATRYRPGLNLVLNGISCNIRPGEKVGIVGRTGAGKSSLTLALFRLIEAAGGRIIIDNIDIGRLGLHQLRSKLTILPQDPVVFSGSIRHNLDPFSVHNDERLWNSLEHAGLRDFVSHTEKGLDHECGENGESLSVGQRQLLCLARALLNKSKVLILDEATAAVDVESDEQIMDTIRREFADCTVLTIAHRLHTVMDSERVIILDKGEIVEFDAPQTLLNNPKSVFASMARSAATVGKSEIPEENVDNSSS